MKQLNLTREDGTAWVRARPQPAIVRAKSSILYESWDENKYGGGSVMVWRKGRELFIVDYDADGYSIAVRVDFRKQGRKCYAVEAFNALMPERMAAQYTDGSIHLHYVHRLDDTTHVVESIEGEVFNLSYENKEE